MKVTGWYKRLRGQVNETPARVKVNSIHHLGGNTRQVLVTISRGRDETSMMDLEMELGEAIGLRNQLSRVIEGLQRLGQVAREVPIGFD